MFEPSLLSEPSLSSVALSFHLNFLFFPYRRFVFISVFSTCCLKPVCLPCLALSVAPNQRKRRPMQTSKIREASVTTLALKDERRTEDVWKRRPSSETYCERSSDAKSILGRIGIDNFMFSNRGNLTAVLFGFWNWWPTIKESGIHRLLLASALCQTRPSQLWSDLRQQHIAQFKRIFVHYEFEHIIRSLPALHSIIRKSWEHNKEGEANNDQGKNELIWDPLLAILK